jgi:[ribosomal protein S18]-alanine N-acetyltransferase
MHYRLYKPEDFEALYAIEETCFQPPYRFSRAYMRKVVQRRNTATWVAEEDAKLAGFAIVDWTERERVVTAYIQTIEVTPKVRKRGVGGELLRRVEETVRAAHAAVLWLHVEVRNTAAMSLYEAHGYRCEGREEDFYGPDRPALIFVKPLRAEALA